LKVTGKISLKFDFSSSWIVAPFIGTA